MPPPHDDDVLPLSRLRRAPEGIQLTRRGVIAAGAATAALLGAQLLTPSSARALQVAPGGMYYPTDPWRYNHNEWTHYGTRPNGKMHWGIDSQGGVNQPIFSVLPGRVVAGTWGTTASDGHGWGNNVLIDHGNGFATRYAHFSAPPFVGLGAAVQAGQHIGAMGGSAEGDLTALDRHLHFEVRQSGNLVSPLDFLNGTLGTFNPGAPGSGAPVQAPTVFMDASGRISLYRIQSGDLMGCTQTAAGGSFGPWQTIGSTGAGLSGSPFLLQDPSGVIILYARTNAGTIVGTNQSSPGGGFLPWQTIGFGGNGIVSDPFAIQMPDGRIAVYAAADGGIISGVGQAAPGGSFGTWTMIGNGGNGLSGRPAVLVLPDGRISIHALSQSRSEILTSTQTAAGGAFPAWASTGTGGLGVTSEPTALLRDGRIRVFAGAGSTVSTVAQTTAGGPFGAWVNVGSGPASLASTRPGVLAVPSGYAVYMRGQDSNAWGTTIPVSPSGPTGWAQTGHGATISTPVTPLMSAFSTIVLYAANSNGSVVGTNQSAPGSAFGSWVALS